MQHPVIHPSKHSALSPAVFAHQLDKPATAQVGLLYAARIAHKLDHFLGILVAHGDNHPAADSQLVDQNFGDFGRPGGNDDGVKRAFIFPPGGSIRVARHDIVIAELVKQATGFNIKTMDTLDGINTKSDLGQNSGLVSGTGSKFPAHGHRL